MNRLSTITPRGLGRRPLAAAATVVALTAAAAWASLGALGSAEAASPAVNRRAVDDGVPMGTSPFAVAGAQLRAGRFADAYGRYAALADAGDESAAWMALAMVANGREIFGSEWSATPGQLSRWNALASRRATRVLRTIPDHARDE